MYGYINLFEQYSEYENYIDNMGGYKRDSINACIENDEISFDKDVRIVCKLNTPYNRYSTKLIGSGETSQFKEIEIDGNILPDIVTGYTFENKGEHSIIFTLANKSVIGDNAFHSTQAGIDGYVYIPNNVKQIGSSAFGNANIKQIRLSNSLESIGGYGFASSSLNAITIPRSVTAIGNYSLNACNNLQSIVVEKGNPVYDSRDNCNALIETLINQLRQACNNTVIPSSVRSIAPYAFNFPISSITIPDGVELIYYNAFNAAGNLTSLRIPNSVTSIWQNGFNGGLSSANTVTVDSGNTIYDSRNNCNAIIETATNKLILGSKNTVIPNTVTELNGNCFQYCRTLKRITIPDSVTKIGNNSFAGCSILTSVKMKSVIPPTLGASVFLYHSEDLRIYVPQEALNTYKTATNWSAYSDIIEGYIDYEKKYLTFEALESGTFTLTIGSAVTPTLLSSLSYSLDDGETWTTTNNVVDQTVTITTPTVNIGDKVLWKGSGTAMASGTPYNVNRASTFSSTARFNAYGSAMSLLYGDNFSGVTEFASESQSNFMGLFYYNTNITDASNLILPATTLANYCYDSMFYGCTNLTTAPELPATTLADYCYNGMFRGCIHLTTAPSLPATSLETNCYRSMFNGCSGLTTVPTLPATTLALSCYQYMFYGCTSLTTAPSLPATTLASSCYMSMFEGCTSLTTAPSLPATTLYFNCYANMFEGCTSLTTTPSTLPATTLAQSCYEGMFRGCTSLTTVPSTLPATTLAYYCYRSMFNGCSGLTTVPTLPATTLTSSCYQYMFYGCTSLTTAPELPATALTNGCYNQMFSGCTNLNYIKAMFTTTPSTTYTSNWVAGVAANGTFVKSSSATWNVTGVNGVPSGWIVQTASS